MFRSDYITTQLSGLVGWRQPTIGNLPTIDSTNRTASSGLYFEDSHPLSSIKNLFYCQEDDSISTVDFNRYLGYIQLQAILRALNDVVKGESDFCYNKTLFPYEAAFKNLISKTEKRFVGYRIQLDASRKKLVNVNSIILSFDRGVTITLYLFNSQVEDPIQEQEIAFTGPNDHVEVVNWPIELVSDTYRGGAFYIGYFCDDLGDASAYKRDWQDANVMAATAGFSIEPVTATYSSPGVLFDVTTVQPVDHNAGINLDFSVYNDYTELILTHKAMFTQAIQLYGGILVLEQIVNTTRSNITERVAKEAKSFAFVALNGDSQEKSVGLYSRYQQQINTIRKTLFNKPLFTKTTLR